MTERKIDPNKWSDPKRGAALTVRVVTRAANTELVGIQEDGSLKIRLISSPASDPAANTELVGFLAQKLGIGKDKIEIVQGSDGRDKIVIIEGISADELEAKLTP
jgi:uncharacterized protein (TIGR00251 family)